MSGNDLITFWSKQFQNDGLAAILNLCNFVIFKQPKIKAKCWTMHIEQNVMTHTRITHDKFCKLKSKMADWLLFWIVFSHYLGLAKAVI